MPLGAGPLLAALLHTTPASAACPPLPLAMQAVAPGVWVKPAQPNAPSGWTEPTVVWADAHTTWVLDPGPHRCAGLALRRWLTQHLPGRTQHLINTHAHPENVLANSAWPAGTPIHALAGTRAQMNLRCPTCLANLRQTLGQRWMQGTTIVLPNQVLQPDQWLTLAGQRWQVRAHTHAHTESHLSLWQPEQRTWVAAGLLAWGGGLPDLGRSRVKPWLAALNEVQATHPEALWGGPSPEAGLAQLARTQGYLQALDDDITQAMAQGKSVLEHLGQPLSVALVPLVSLVQGRREMQRHQLNVMHEWQLREDEDWGVE
jgi:glyoxylase-like metal-dependent hydrolase (beta-lactamase superfamily II)